MSKKTRHALTAILMALPFGLMSACSLNPAELPLPGTHIGEDSYPVNIEFTSVLSLTAKAKVNAGGVQVGVLDHVQLAGRTAVAVVRISSAVTLPKNTRAELRQATILGDMYIALTVPDNPSPALLRGGDTIPLQNTAPPTSVEDLLRYLSSLLTGTSLTGLSDALSSFHKVFGSNPDQTAEQQRQLADMLHDLAANQAVLDQLAADADGFAGAAEANAPAIGDLLARVPSELDKIGPVITKVVDFIIAVGVAAESATPLLDDDFPGLSQALLSVTPLVAAISTVDTNLSVIVNRSLGLLRDAFVAFFWRDGGPRVTVNAVDVPDSALVLGGVDPQDRADEMIQVLQSMGLLAR